MTEHFQKVEDLNSIVHRQYHLDSQQNKKSKQCNEELECNLKEFERQLNCIHYLQKINAIF
jgi:hypothetical protein